MYESMAALWKSWEVVAETTWPTKLKLFTIWPFTGKQKQKTKKQNNNNKKQQQQNNCQLLVRENIILTIFPIFIKQPISGSSSSIPAISTVVQTLSLAPLAYGNSPQYIPYHPFLTLLPDPRVVVVSIWPQSAKPLSIASIQVSKWHDPTFNFKRTWKKERTLPTGRLQRYNKK